MVTAEKLTLRVVAVALTKTVAYALVNVAIVKPARRTAAETYTFWPAGTNIGGGDGGGEGGGEGGGKGGAGEGGGSESSKKHDAPSAAMA
jgi:hypothetical protein